MSSSGMRVDWRSADQSSRSVYWEKGSRLERMVPLKRLGSWGMMVRRERRSWRPTRAMSWSSIIIEPVRICFLSYCDLMMGLGCVVRTT